MVEIIDLELRRYRIKVVLLTFVFVGNARRC